MIHSNLNISYQTYSFAVLLISHNNPSLNIRNQFDSHKLISPNFMMNLINKYWQETIFLSQVDPVSNKYINQLKSSGITVNKQQYKKFLYNFGKALMTGRVQASFNEVKDDKIIGNDKDIKYIWRKGINFAIPKTFPHFILNKRESNFPNKSQEILIKQLKNNQMPVFSITNNFNQIVIAEPSDELRNNKNILDKIYQIYHDNFLWTIDQQPIYESLFFMNPQDAIEYKNYIKHKYFDKKNINNVKIFASNVEFYYRLARTSPPRVQFRLIPDLQEVSQLIYKYKYSRNISFHKQQKEGYDYFQGQPIYFIQPIFAKNKQTNKIEKLYFNYQLNHDGKECEAVFINYNVLLRAWNKFVTKQTNHILPKKPKVIVYNLESFLKKYDNNANNNMKNILLIPNKDSYEFIKVHNINKSNYGIIKSILYNLMLFKTLSQRIIWSLTSRQPTTW